MLEACLVRLVLRSYRATTELRMLESVPPVRRLRRKVRMRRQGLPLHAWQQLQGWRGWRGRPGPDRGAWPGQDQ